MDTLPKSKILLSKMTLFIFTMLLSASALFAQQAPTIEWQKCLGGINADYAECIIQTSDGGYAIAGYTSSTDGDVVGSHRAENNLSVTLPDAWVVKLNSKGELEWQKCLGGSGNDYFYSIKQNADGGYIVAGSTDSKDGDVNGNHGDLDAWVVKLDSSGNLLWQKCLGGSSDESAQCIIQTADTGKGYIIAGYTTSTDGDVSGKHKGSYTNSYDAWVVKIDSSGIIEWQKCLGGTGYDAAQSIIQSIFGGYVIAGSTTSTDGDITGKHKGLTDPSYDAWIVKINDAGNMEWQKCLGGSNTETANSIIESSEEGGGFIIAGKTNSSDGDVSGFHVGTSDAYSDVWVVKLTSTGIIQWQKCLGGSQNDEAYSIIQTGNDDYVIAGKTSSNDGDIAGKHISDPLKSGPDDIWIVKLNSSGNIIWHQCYGGPLENIPNSIINTFDKGFAFAGWTNSYDGEVSGSHSSFSRYNNDGWIVKLTNDASSAVDITNSDFINKKFFWIYPNPSTEQVRLELLQSLQMKQVQFYDIMGIERSPDYHLESSSALVDIHNLSNGTYITRVAYIRKGIPGTFTLPFIVQH